MPLHRALQKPKRSPAIPPFGHKNFKYFTLRQPEALPEAGDIEGQAAFWKQHYNTPLGAGTVSKYAFKVQKAFKAA